MTIDPLEAERLAHLQTRRALVQVSAQLVERDQQIILAGIRARLGIVGEFQVMGDGSIIVEAAPEAPAASAPAAAAAAESAPEPQRVPLATNGAPAAD